MTPNTIEFKTTHDKLHNTWVMRITADRRIEVNEEVEVTESAKKVLEAMQWMLNKQKRNWVGLTLDERIELAQDVDWAVGAYCEYAEKIEARLKDLNT
jgi:hypothetical protein